MRSGSIGPHFEDACSLHSMDEQPYQYIYLHSMNENEIPRSNGRDKQGRRKHILGTLIEHVPVDVRGAICESVCSKISIEAVES